MRVHDHAPLLARAPHRVVDRRVQRRDRRVGRTPGSSTPPRRPWSAIQCTSRTASSTSFRRIWPMPARRSGNSAHHVGQPPVVGRAGRRSRSSKSSALGGGRRSAALGEERRHGVGVDHLGDDAVGLEVAHAARAVPVAVGVAAARDRRNGLTKLSAQSSNSSRYVGFEERPVVEQVGAGMTVGGDDGVALHDRGRFMVIWVTVLPCRTSGGRSPSSPAAAAESGVRWASGSSPRACRSCSPTSTSRCSRPRSTSSRTQRGDAVIGVVTDVSSLESVESLRDMTLDGSARCISCATTPASRRAPTARCGSTT